jgi:hypothetical protein
MDDIRISTIDIIIKKQKAALKLIGPVEILDLPIQSMVICPSGLSESILLKTPGYPRVN